MGDQFLDELDEVVEKETEHHERRSVLTKFRDEDLSENETKMEVPQFNSAIKHMMSGRISQKKSLVSYKLDDDVINLITKHSKHISKSSGGKSAFVNNLLIDALKMHGYWEE